MRNKYLILMLFCSFSCKAQTGFTLQEKEYIAVFSSFITEIKSSLKTDIDITQSDHLKKFLLQYLFINARIDSLTRDLTTSEASYPQVMNIQKQLGMFARFMQEQDRWDHISALPARYAPDKYIYNHLTPFQRENSLIFFDIRKPQEIIGFILFIPPTKKVIASPRIWSWTLTFQFGKYMYRSIGGEDGQEYIFGN